MENNQQYQRIALAIDYIKDNFQQQPSLNELAELVNLSPFHFQRLFSDWAGVSPKKFIQYISVEHAKALLKQPQSNVLDTAYATGLSGSGRLHDLFINIEAMTPGEYKNSAQSLVIDYSVGDSPFGKVLIASTTKGICHIEFVGDEQQGIASLQAKYAKAQLQSKQMPIHLQAQAIFLSDWHNVPQQASQIKLHLKGTAFQLKVWQALLQVPMGELSSYGSIAEKIGNAKASRAVGTAIGSNPVAFLIPCHRVIQASGNSGGYRWGDTRKSAIIGWESAKREIG
ncbi:MAG: methylated-DNA--[protein]-cysteine S-methyltransferase [Oceanospirillaceae bacterium]